MTGEPVTPVAHGKAVIGIARTLFLSILGRQDAKGIVKYGQSLHTWNGRNPLEDAQEEAVDLWQYLTQARMEREYVHDALARWVKAIDNAYDDLPARDEYAASVAALERVARRIIQL